MMATATTRRLRLDTPSDLKGDMTVSPLENAATSAHTALREATQALTVARSSHQVRTRLSEAGCRLLARDVAANLEALTELLRSVDLDDLPSGATTADFHAMAQHLSVGAGMARRVADRAAQARRTEPRTTSDVTTSRDD